MPEQRRFEKTADESVSWLQKNTGIVAAVVGVLVIIVAVLLYGEWSKWKEEKQIRDQYYLKMPPKDEPEARMQALLELANNHPNTMVGKLAKLDYANALYEAGQYAQAEEAYDAVLKRVGAKDPLGERAKMGLGYCAEQKGEKDKARKIYEEIKAANGLYAYEADRMLTEMDNAPAIPGGVALPKVEVPAGQVPSAPAPVGSAGTATKGSGN